MKKVVLGMVVIAVAVLAFVAVINNERASVLHAPRQNPQTTDTRTGAQPSCSGKQIVELTEGPYYTPNTPPKKDFMSDNPVGEEIVLTGYVLDTACKPIANAWLDFWHADGEGNYDNEGFRLRGHQFTDENGKYTLTTIVPGRYTGRTPHIHFKVRATPTSPVITSQLFISNETQNETDSLYDKSLEMNVQNAPGGKTATFDIVVNR